MHYVKPDYRWCFYILPYAKLLVVLYFLPDARPLAVFSDFFISVSLKARSSFMVVSSLEVGKWWNRARF